MCEKDVRIVYTVHVSQVTIIHRMSGTPNTNELWIFWKHGPALASPKLTLFNAACTDPGD